MQRGEREVLPMRRAHGVVEFECGDHRYRGGVGPSADGRVLELWLNAEKTGSLLDVLGADAAILASLALQYGCPLGVMRGAVKRNGSGAASGPVGALIDMVMEGMGPS